MREFLNQSGLGARTGERWLPRSGTWDIWGRLTPCKHRIRPYTSRGGSLGRTGALGMWGCEATARGCDGGRARAHPQERAAAGWGQREQSHNADTVVWDNFPRLDPGPSSSWVCTAPTGQRWAW